MSSYSLLLSGGGTAGLVYIGVFRRLRELNINIQKILSVSVGSICALLYILNYSDEDLQSLLLNTDFKTFTNKKIKIYNLLNNYGIDNFNKIKQFIEFLLDNKGIDKNITFNNFYNLNNFHFQITASNIHKNELTIFDYINTPNIKIVDAIKISCCVPFFFIPMKYNGELYVDGGLINNFPIKLLNDDLPNVIGIKILRENVIKQDIENILDYSQNILNILLLNRTDSSTYEEHKGVYIIKVPDNNLLNFHITTDQINDLIKLGYDSIQTVS